MKVQVEGSTGMYTIDTEELTCDCANWRYRCHNFGRTDERRLCKHLVAYFDAHPELKPISLIQKDKLLDAASNPDSKPKQLRVMFDPFVAEINSAFKNMPGVIEHYSVCGDYRRLCSKIESLEFIVSLKEGQSFDQVSNYLSNILSYDLINSTENTWIFSAFGLAEVTVHLVPNSSWILSLIHYTGNKAELLSLRNRAAQLGYTLTSTELIVNSTNRPAEIIFESEQDVYNLLKLQYKEPWLRNN